MFTTFSLKCNVLVVLAIPFLLLEMKNLGRNGSAVLVQAFSTLSISSTSIRSRMSPSLGFSSTSLSDLLCLDPSENSNSPVNGATATATTTAYSGHTVTTHYQSIVPMPWTIGVSGEADRAYQRAKELDQMGYARVAAGAYHQAATLFQCYLDLKSCFQHVSNLENKPIQIPIVLSHALANLARLNRDALGDYKAAIRLYTMATQTVLSTKDAATKQLQQQQSTMAFLPLSESYQGLGISLEAAAGGNGTDLKHLKQAVDAYQHALDASKQTMEQEQQQQQQQQQQQDKQLLYARTLFFKAVALERLGHTEQSEEILESLQRQEAPMASLVDSWGYVRWHSRKVDSTQLNLYRGTRDMLKLGLDAAMPLIISNTIANNKECQLQQQQQQQHPGQEVHDHPSKGLVCEFGVGSGRSLRLIQEMLPLDVRVYGFDTFTGLPQPWGTLPAGTYSTGGIPPNVEGDCVMYKGLFRDSIPVCLNDVSKGKSPASPPTVVAFANIDCKLYTSIMDVLENLHGYITKGSILVFNEYICHPTWRQDGFRAWRECCKRFGWKYEYLGFSLATRQAVVRVTG